jgi:EAL domain-containing protein (putative c-di-GMP-specific phosphodiesterase class I)
MKLITTGAEARLVEHLTTHKQQMQQTGIAVMFHFSQLLEHYRSDYQIKIATNLLTDLLKHQEGGIYLFKDANLMVVGDTIPESLLEKAIFQSRYLFMDDPLAYTADGQENPRFCHIYYLDKEYDEVAAQARKAMLGGRQAATAGSSSATVIPIPTLEKKKASGESKFFNASNLERLEKAISESNLLPALRRQPICATVTNMSVRRVFDELYLNVNHLRELIKTDIDLLSNRWLFKYLTLEMDNRVLSLIKQKADQYLGSPISLNLNVRTLMSEQFAEFDRVLKPAVKVSIVLEIQASDVFEDMVAFASARDYVQKLGYRICLDGLNNKSFCMIDRDILGVDLLKLQWNAAQKNELHTKEGESLAAAVRRCGANRIILTRCDNRLAVDYGQSLGVSLFQGRYLDELIDPMSETVN